MREDIVLLDGASGTSLWEKTEDKVAVWRYNVEQPEIVKELLQEYVDAGCEYIQANTFGANRTAMKKIRPSLTNKAAGIKKPKYDPEMIVTEAMHLAHEVLDGKAKIMLAAGPLTGLLEPYGDITEEECREYYEEHLGAGMKVGADGIFLLTYMDLKMLQIATSVAKQYDVPVFCSMSFEENGRTLMGNSPKDIIDALAPMGVEAIGINCSLGPDMALDIIKEFSENTDIPLFYKPNAGKPILDADGKEQKGFDIETFVDDVMKALDYNVKYVGGCCGSNPAYLKRLREKIDEKKKEMGVL
ncbi:MAG: homocysteine S-methyltransferase family protein [Eubacteriales bacterium]|nr:homocysteine S-methyltransferase family protein [Eubacteriales bacterium]